MVLLLYLSLEWRSATRPLISNHIFFLRLNSARTSAFLTMCSKRMKKPCDEKKKKQKQKNEKQHLFRFYFLCWISYFFCYWKIRQSRPTIVLKQMDFAAFTSKHHLKMFDWRQMGGWVCRRITSQTKVFVTSNKESRRAKNFVPWPCMLNQWLPQE